MTARWVVDASGRAGLLKRKLGLVRSQHARRERLVVAGQVARARSTTGPTIPAWQARVASGLRWQSTVHLMGAGYWVWLIPLGSGSHSFGIVADGDMHPFNRINRFERAMDWLREFEPQCAARHGRAHAHELEDFLALQHFAHSLRARLLGRSLGAGRRSRRLHRSRSTRRAPTSSRWATTTSPISSSATSPARTSRARTESFNTMYLRLFEAFIRLYDGQYRIMGNAQVMTAKIAWDNACYWAITALLFFQRRYRQPEFIDSIDPLMRRFFVLHARMQSFFSAWDQADDGAATHAGGSNVVDVDFLRQLQASLGEPMIDDEPLRDRLTSNFALLEAFARSWQAIAAERYPAIGAGSSAPAPGAPRARLSVRVPAERGSDCSRTPSHARSRAESLPPKPSDVETAQRTRCSRVLVGDDVELRNRRRSRRGGWSAESTPRAIVSASAAASTAPDAPRQWPIIDLIEVTGSRAVRVAEHASEAARLGGVVLRRRRAVRVDVIDARRRSMPASASASAITAATGAPFGFGRRRVERLAAERVAGQLGVDVRAAASRAARAPRAPGCPRPRRCSCRRGRDRTAGTAAGSIRRSWLKPLKVSRDSASVPPARTTSARPARIASTPRPMRDRARRAGGDDAAARPLEAEPRGDRVDRRAEEVIPRVGRAASVRGRR